MKHTLETHREYIAISNQNKFLCDMSRHELKIMRCETPDVNLFFEIEEEMQKRGLLKTTMRQTFQDMTGGNVTS